MINEIMLLVSVVVIYGAVLVAYRLFGKSGMYAMTVIATILANIEVLILIDGFGMEQTLGNVMFASTYLVTDILSENEGKRYASKAVYIGIFTSVAMLVFTGMWMLYTPSEADTVMPAVRQIFSKTPRLMLASTLGYAVSQRFDVWLYHAWWDFTSKRSDSRKFLWLRNNASTFVSQLINTVLFTLVAFLGEYDVPTVINIMLSAYVIYIFTSLLDTPVVYIARKMKEKGKIK